ncbi:MAG: hypothetical protein ACLP6E_04305 [Acidimicrobiales bacterium]
MSIPWLLPSWGLRSCPRSRPSPDQLELVPPDTTVGEVVVVVGAVVVVVGAAVVAVVALDPGVSEDEVEDRFDDCVDGAVEEADDDVTCDVTCDETALLGAAPGISLETRPPRTAAVSAAPPVAIPVARLTFRMAAALWWAGSRRRIGSS